jgi:hypothetical protein
VQRKMDFDAQFGTLRSLREILVAIKKCIGTSCDVMGGKLVRLNYSWSVWLVACTNVGWSSTYWYGTQSTK